MNLNIKAVMKLTYPKDKKYIRNWFQQYFPNH